MRMKYSTAITVTASVIIMAGALFNSTNNFFLRATESKKAATEIKKKTEGRFLVAFNAIGEKNHLPLVEHARRNIFKSDKWDCMAFIFAKEEFLSANDTYVQRLEHDQDCNIIRMPKLAWGDFLQIMHPVLISQYDYVAVVLDDVFIPDQEPHLVNTNKLISNMKKYDIHVISPGVVGESHHQLERAQVKGLGLCIVEVNFIETYVQIFSKEAWACYYHMLHHTGSKGWWYDVKFKEYCPHIKMAQDFSMRAFHMGRATEIPKEYDIYGTDLVNWKPAGQLTQYGYHNIEYGALCQFRGWDCSGAIFRGKFHMRNITCPNLEDI